MTRSHGRSVRLADVAARAGVSIAAASFAMSGRPGVSVAVAERVRAVADELGYVPNTQARALASGASPMIGLVVHDVADPYFAELSAAVVDSAAEHGLMVQIGQSSRDPGHELEQVRSLISSQVRGIVIAGSGSVRGHHSDPTYTELKRFNAAGGRVAMIGRHRTSLDAVIADDRTAGLLVGRHVTTLGHRRVGIVAGPRELASAVDRLQGVTEAFDECADDVVTTQVHSAFTHAGGQAAAAELLESHPDVTALVALNDSMAAGVISVLREQGRRIPDDVTVTGVDDVAVAADLGPGLTTIRLPLRQMGAAAVELLTRKPAARPRRVGVDVTLVVRGSSAAPPARRTTRQTRTGGVRSARRS